MPIGRSVNHAQPQRCRGAYSAEARHQINRLSSTEAAIWDAINHADQIGRSEISAALLDILETRTQRAMGSLHRRQNLAN
jgi:hypothetical protein